MNRYARRQNTDFWHARFSRLIWDGERLKEKPLESLKKFNDLKEYKDRVDEWIKEIANQIHMIFEDESLVDEFASPVDNIDLKNDSWLDVTEKLKANIDERIQGLNALTSNTLSSEVHI